MKNISDNPNANPQPKTQEEAVQYHHGRGAQINTKNKFLINEVSKEHIEAIDDWEEKLAINNLSRTGSKNHCK